MSSRRRFLKNLKSVWANGILTHNGPKVREFENALIAKLGLNNFVDVTNGNHCSSNGYQSFKFERRNHYSAFTWIATVSAIKWEICVPVFCDL